VGTPRGPVHVVHLLWLHGKLRTASHMPTERGAVVRILHLRMPLLQCIDGHHILDAIAARFYRRILTQGTLADTYIIYIICQVGWVCEQVTDTQGQGLTVIDIKDKNRCIGRHVRTYPLSALATGGARFL